MEDPPSVSPFYDSHINIKTSLTPRRPRRRRVGLSVVVDSRLLIVAFVGLGIVVVVSVVLEFRNKKNGNKLTFQFESFPGGISARRHTARETLFSGSRRDAIFLLLLLLMFPRKLRLITPRRCCCCRCRRQLFRKNVCRRISREGVER